jgi:polyisoprenoid-binding protein YceI
MKKIISSIGVIIILAGVYIFIKDQQIKKELSTVEESQFVERGATTTSAQATSAVQATRTNGVWSSTSTGQYLLDATSLKFEFTGYKPGGEHVGTFNAIKADIGIDEKGNPVSAKIVFDPNTVKTDETKLDEHLQAPEFFDTAVYSEATAVIKEFKKEGDSIRAITDLTMKGVTKTLSVPVNIVTVDGKVTFNIDTKIKISDYSIAYGPVLDEVRVALSGVVYKK